MANELLLDITMAYEDSESTAANLQVTKQVSVSTKLIARLKQNVGTSLEIIRLGDVTTSFGFMMLVNRDTTNYIEVHTSTSSGVVIGKMLAGEPYGPVRIGSSITAPAVIANTAACQMDILLIST